MPLSQANLKTAAAATARARAISAAPARLAAPALEAGNLDREDRDPADPAKPDAIGADPTAVASLAAKSALTTGASP